MSFWKTVISKPGRVATIILEKAAIAVLGFGLARENDITVTEVRGRETGCTLCFLAPDSRNDEWSAKYL